MKDALRHLNPGTVALLFVLSVATNGWCVGMPEQMVEAHNKHRAAAGTPPLAWSAALAQQAQDWAQHLIGSGKYAPRNDGKYGENLFEIRGGAATPEQVVDAWAAEKQNYDSKANRCRARCGHFTQVVWRGTKSVGCGSARSGGREVWVCNYDPPGNVVGERPY